MVPKLAFIAAILILAIGFNASYAQSSIPSWVKNDAKWWSAGQIGDSEYLKSIQWLVDNGFISVNQTSIPVPAQAQPASMIGPLWKQTDSNTATLIKSFPAAQQEEHVLQGIANPADIITADEATFATKTTAMNEYYADGPSLAQGLPEFNSLRHSPESVCASTDLVLNTGESINVACYVGVTVWHFQATGGPEVPPALEQVIEKMMSYAS